MRIVIPLFAHFTALDAIGPYEVLQRLPGAQVTFAAKERGVVRTDSGVAGLHADATLDEVDAADILVVPGGPGTRALIRDEEALSWVRAIHETTRWTTSVCTGSLVLAAAGLLDGLDATTHWAAVETLEKLGARYTPERVVRRGKLVTAAGVSAGIDMALALAALAAGEQVAKALQLAVEYDPQPPFDAGSPAKAGPQVVALFAALRG
ncbi:DJ-1/PfpI family protein [Actinocrinis puniceicyclus]|uniref:DJ-1/PfpI family protein n=1 Tax=Actinocrinis puniceicyclus TaxID=977794 RepID=A0A8J7WQ97_9ACTN|nr:DJ-1/PfpI family protein [Actinocrinis puniceicyclus]MBS2964079.1 DJ-1/PfpI family protein [Actinocrinis puniceicyclus]